MHLDWNLPYCSRRVPVFARNVVATSHPLAAQAGLAMLVKGGNAVDAALACAIALTVVEPCSNGLGSDAFCILWDGANLHGLNGSGRSPASWTPRKFEGRDRITVGVNSITVPGAVDAWSAMSNGFGKLPFADLFEPAVRYAEQGFAVSPTVQHNWAAAIETYANFPGFRQAFMPGGRAPQVGELLQNPAQARTLRRIAVSRGEDFYRGELARMVVDFLAENGGEMTCEDMAGHESEWVEPISVDYGEVTAFEIPPNSQGIAALVALGILEHLDLRQYPLDSADSIHLQIEATRIGLHLAQTHVADAGSMKISTSRMLDQTGLKQYADSIDPMHAGGMVEVPPGGGTVYLTAADENGMMVSFIQSNFWGFGSGLVVPDTGISLQNRAAGFSLVPNHPNAVDGGKRPFQTIIPGFVMRAGAPLMSFGVMGAHMQAQGHVQMMTRIFTYRQNPQAASDAPRWYIGEDGCTVFETGFNPEVVADLVHNRGHRLSTMEPPFSFGGAQLVYRMDNGLYCAASDHRKDGQAVGY